MQDEENAVKIPVPSEDPPKEKNENEDIVIGKDENIGPAEESEEDRLLREKLETNAKRITEMRRLDVELLKRCVDILSSEIKSATGSMTSVPKPLKFLRPFYDDLKKFYYSVKEKLSSDLQKSFADMMAVLAMTMAAEGSREMLVFKLEANTGALGEWGHEFVRALCGEISQEYAGLEDKGSAKSKQLKAISKQIVPFLIEQNTETEAVDLLFEVEELPFLLSGKFIDASNYERTCLYLMRFSEYLFNWEEVKAILNTTYELYVKCNDLPNALRTALMMNDQGKIEAVFAKEHGGTAEEIKNLKMQLGYIMGAQKSFNINVEDDDINDKIWNGNLSENFKILAQNLGMEAPKSTEDVYKSFLYDDDMAPNTQSAQVNLAATYVNGFVNCGFGVDTLLEKPVADRKPNETSWVFLNQDKGKTAALATLGLVKLWDLKSGTIDSLNEWLDEEQKDVYCTAGALLGMGVASAGMKDGDNIVASLLADFFSERDGDAKKSDSFVKICGCLGMGIGFCGNEDESIKTTLMDFLEDENSETSVKAFASLALGMMFVGTGNAEVGSAITQLVAELDGIDVDQTTSRFILLGWSLIYLGKQNLEDEEKRANLDELQKSVVSACENKAFAELGLTMLDVCSYAGSGNVIQVQKLLQLCAQHLNEDGLTQEEAEEKRQEAEDNKPKNDNKDDDDEKEEEKAMDDDDKPLDKEKAAKNAARQAMAVLGVALITFGDPVGKQMAERTFQHLLQYGDLAVRRAVPLAMALIRVSDPDYGQIDILSKLSHDSDKMIAMSAIFAMGIMAAGTTNSRVAQLLRQLAVFYKKEKEVLLVVRLAQGLLFTGKGLVTLHPYHSDRTLLSPVALAGVLTVMVAALDIKNTLLDEKKYHVLMFALATAIRPRMCMTMIEENGELVPHKVKVRVGQAVETVGQAGNPKKITGFQTQETPVLLNVGDRVELAGEDYVPYSTILEGVVVLKKVDKMEEVESN